MQRLSFVRATSSLAVILASLGLMACSDIDDTAQSPLGDVLPIDEELALPGLSGPVDAVRDKNGRMHIYATNVADAMLVQGYLVARDRHVQLELARRLSQGRLAEMFGALDPSLIESDISFRHLGLHRVAREMDKQVDDELREVLDAFSMGVSLLFEEIRSGKRPLGKGIAAVDPAMFTPWEPADSLTMGRLQTWLLSYTGDHDLNDTALYEDLTQTFKVGDADPLVAARAGIERDYLRFEPPDDATILTGIDAIGVSKSSSSAKQPTTSAQRPARIERLRELVAATRGYRDSLRRARRLLAPEGDFGSNNWAVGPERSATGNALLASDPHLGLTSPATFWPLSIHIEHKKHEDGIKDLHVGGLSFPGIPGIILGHNAHLAWGATVANYDVTDVYAETLNAKGDAVVFGGDVVKLETIDEVIIDGDGEEVVYSVKIVPHHGPIIPTIVDGKVVDPDPLTGALSVRWTGMVPTGELSAVVKLMRAQNVDEAHEALKDFGTGAQNWMLADTSGDIAWTSHALVPYRKDAALDWDASTGRGQLPCFVLAGDGTSEWTGFWPDDAVPWAKNPHAGYLATANNDPLGGTLDNDPSDDLQPDGSSAYLACSFARGFRAGRIQERIEGHQGLLSLEDMSDIQADHRSVMGSKLVPALLVAIGNAQAEKTGGGKHPDLSEVVADPAYDLTLVGQLREMLIFWGNEADYVAASGVNPDDNKPLDLEQDEARAAQATLLFNAWLVRFLARTFGDELARVDRPAGTGHHSAALLHLMTSDPANLATYDPATGDSALWDDIDTPAVESRQERMIRALLDAVAWLQSQVGAPDTWRWGSVHTVTFESLAPVFNFNNPSPFEKVFLGGYPRHGDMFAVDASNYDVTREVGSNMGFSYGSGPNQRFVIEMSPDGLVARNVIPGGAVIDVDGPHFTDQAEQWRRNQVHDVPFVLEAVVAAAESRTLLRPAQ